MTNPTTFTAQPGTPFIELDRTFEAPVDRVYRAHIEPELVERWLGPRDLETSIETWDMRFGGTYRYIQRRGTAEFAFRGVVHEAVTNQRITQTFEFEGAPGQVGLGMSTFTDLGDGRTRLHTLSVFPSVEVRDAALQTGMEGGATESFERLNEMLLVSLP